MNNNIIIDSNITPTDVKIYTENGTPYLDYTGICYASNGDKIKVHLPKIGLTFTNITQEKDYKEYERHEEQKCLWDPRKILPKFNIYASNDIWATFEVIEREVSKERLEKELDYKLTLTKK